jgi:hypothetical protein
MAFIPVSDGYRFKLHFKDLAGNQALNVIWLREESESASVARLNGIATVIETWAGAHWDTVSSNQWELFRIEGQDMQTEFGFYTDVAVSVSGANDVDPAPSEVTVAVSLRTGKAGRSFRGRLYHVGLDDAAFDGDYLSPSHMAAIIAAYEELKDALELIDITWCIASFYADGVARAAGLLTPITTITITDNIVDSMRSRKPRP